MPFPANRPGVAILLLLALATLLASAPLLAGEQPKKESAEKGQGKQQGPPPALVVTATSRSGEIQPQLLYVGTIYFPEVAQVAAEVQGRVEEYSFEEGQRVTKGDPLVELNTDLVEKDLETARFEHKNVLTLLESAQRELERIQKLFKKKTVSEQDFDKAFFLVAGLENRATALAAKSSRLELQLEKSTVKAPFDGVVLHRDADRGEWIAPGSTVATIARNDVVDVHVYVPQDVLPFLEKGMPMSFETGGRELQGEVYALIPEGDVATRTFPVKIRAANDGSLAQGMEARVHVPAGEKQQSVLVPRDAVLMNMGQNSLWAVFGDSAVNVPVEITAYQGLEVAVRSLSPQTKLTEGMQVVIKGNERLRPGQKVQVAGSQGEAQTEPTEAKPEQKAQ